MIFNVTGGGGGGTGATLTVTAPAGVTVTVSKDGKTKTKVADSSGVAVFKGLATGEWTLSIRDGSQFSKKPVVITADYSTAIAFFSATINITYPAGSTCTVTDGVTKLDAPDASGVWECVVPNTGTWTISCTDGSEKAELHVEITYDGQTESAALAYVKIYGIYRDITASTPIWTREDDAVGKTATASVGTVAGSSDFDSCYPWSEIQRETLPTGDVMVSIPKFWFRRYQDGNIEHIKIADKAVDGFTLHPAFNHAGVEKNYLYVGAYKTSSNNKSVSGATPTVSQTRANMRTNAKAKGNGWSLIDIAAVSAIQMLILVEFATNNVQDKSKQAEDEYGKGICGIGRGYCDASVSDRSGINTGSCDTVAGLTGIPAGTDGKVDVVWRGIEGFWGNYWEWTDGVNWNNGTYYVCNDPSKYADDTTTNYTELSYTASTSWSSSYITQEGLDTGNNEHVMLPVAADNGSESTYYCDGCWSSTGWRVFRRGAYWANGSLVGIFSSILRSDSSSASDQASSRLLYIPQ